MGRWARFTLVAVLVSLLSTWPWARMIPDHVGAPFVDPDLQCGLWWPRHFADAVLRLENPFFVREFLWPEGQDVTLLVWNFGAQLLFLPVHALLAPPFGANVAGMLTLVLNGLAAAWAGRALTRSDVGAAAGLVLGATDVYAFSEGLSGRPEQALWAPNAIYLGALAMLLHQPGRRRWVGVAGLSLAAAGAVYWFYAWFLIVLTLGVAAVRAASRRLGARTLLDLTGVAAISAAGVLPFLVPVLLAAAEDDHAYTAVKSAARHGVAQQAMASLSAGNLAWPVFRPVDAARAPTLFLLPLLGLALWRGRGAIRVIAALGAVAFVFAMGPVVGTLGALRPGGYTAGPPLEVGGGVLYLPGYLLGLLPGYDRFWWPYRWLGVVSPAVALCGAWAVARAPRRYLLLALLTLGAVGQSTLSVHLRSKLGYRIAVPQVLADIAAMPYPAPVLQLPREANLIAVQALHGQPIGIGLATQIAGVGSVEPPALDRAIAMGIGSGSPRTFTVDEAGGYHYVMVYDATGGTRKGPLAMQASRVLGPPFYDAEGIALWVVPGVGRLPPGYAVPTVEPSPAVAP